jgi:HlyD family secretion protein
MKSIRRKVFIAILLAVLSAGGWFTVRALQNGNSSLLADLQREIVSRGDLNVTIQADGVVHSNQSAELLWRTSGTVAQVNVDLGDEVSAGDALASLESASLPQSVILARIDLVEAQRELDNLLVSQTQRAEALKAVEAAQQALEVALNNEAAQAQALEGVAKAQKAVEQAELNLAIVVKRPSQQAIDQAYANLLLAENVLNRTRQQHEKIQRQLNKPASNYLFFESKALYRGILESLDIKLAQDQRAYEQALKKYNQLLEPVDPLDRMVAEGNVALRKAELDQAMRELERTKNGPSTGEVAVLQAELEDARREFGRWQEGVDPAEISAAQARLAAAQSVLEQAHLSAPFDGVVTMVSINPGDRVSGGAPALRLDDLSPLLISLEVSEIDINQVEVGQSLLIKLDAAPGAEYHGRVTDVPMVSQTDGGVARFIVEAEITDGDELVRPGMTASANIIVNSLKDVLLVPNRAVDFINGDRVVYTERNDHIVPIEVELGPSDGSHSQLLAGDLRSGERLLVDVPEDFQAIAQRR